MVIGKFSTWDRTKDRNSNVPKKIFRTKITLIKKLYTWMVSRDWNLGQFFYDSTWIYVRDRNFNVAKKRTNDYVDWNILIFKRAFKLWDLMKSGDQSLNFETNTNSRLRLEICRDNYAYDTKLLGAFPSTFERRNWNKVDSILSRRI